MGEQGDHGKEHRPAVGTGCHARWAAGTKRLANSGPLPWILQCVIMCVCVCVCVCVYAYVQMTVTCPWRALVWHAREEASTEGVGGESTPETHSGRSHYQWPRRCLRNDCWWLWCWGTGGSPSQTHSHSAWSCGTRTLRNSTSISQRGAHKTADKARRIPAVVVHIQELGAHGIDCRSILEVRKGAALEHPPLGAHEPR